MNTLLKVLAIILLLPILLTVVVLATITLIGGYVTVAAYYLWPILLVIIGLIVLGVVIKHFV